jgi:hypothetical protein
VGTHSGVEDAYASRTRQAQPSAGVAGSANQAYRCTEGSVRSIDVAAVRMASVRDRCGATLGCESPEGAVSDEP